MSALAAVIEGTADGAGALTVTFSSGRTAQAAIVGQDASADIAVIKATGVSGLKPAAFGSAAAAGCWTPGLLSPPCRQRGAGWRNRMLLAEFDYDLKPRPSFPVIDTMKPRYDMWLLKRYGLPALYWNLMLRGRA